jgi:hypothetical protein
MIDTMHTYIMKIIYIYIMCIIVEYQNDPGFRGNS